MLSMTKKVVLCLTVNWCCINDKVCWKCVLRFVLHRVFCCSNFNYTGKKEASMKHLNELLLCRKIISNSIIWIPGNSFYSDNITLLCLADDIHEPWRWRGSHITMSDHIQLPGRPGWQLVLDVPDFLQRWRWSPIHPVRQRASHSWGKGECKYEQ